jgi:hypothetical protein
MVSLNAFNKVKNLIMRAAFWISNQALSEGSWKNDFEQKTVGLKVVARRTR